MRLELGVLIALVVGVGACSGDTVQSFRSFALALDGPLPVAAVGEPYEAIVEADGGEAPRTWRIASGEDVAPGLRLRPDGRVVGTPTAAGRYRTTARVEDASLAVAFVEIEVLVFDRQDPTSGDGSCTRPFRLERADRLRIDGRLPDQPDSDKACDFESTASSFYELRLDLPARIIWTIDSSAEVFVTGVKSCADLEAQVCTPQRIEIADVGFSSVRVFGEPGASFALEVDVLGGTEDGTCEAPIRVDLPEVGDTVALSGVFRAPDREVTSCGDLHQPEVVARVALEDRADLLLQRSRGDFDVALRRQSCRDGVEIACTGDFATAFRDLDPGAYFVVAEPHGPSSSDPEYALRLTRAPPTPRPPNDPCDRALPLELEEGGRVLDLRSRPLHRRRRAGRGVRASGRATSRGTRRAPCRLRLRPSDPRLKPRTGGPVEARAHRRGRPAAPVASTRIERRTAGGPWLTRCGTRGRCLRRRCGPCRRGSRAGRAW